MAETLREASIARLRALADDPVYDDRDGVPVLMGDLRAALARSESPSPEGLDAERLAVAVAFARGRSYVDMLDTLTAQKIKAVYDAGMAEPGALARLAEPQP